MTFPRPFLSRRSASGRCLSFSKSFREFRTQESVVGPLQLTVSNGCEETEGVSSEDSSSRWAELLPELIADIIVRVEAAEAMWPGSRSIVACGSVCKKWREVTREIFMSPLSSGKITFPLCLKKPGPGDWPLQCLIKRDKRNSTFHLYLSVSPSSFTEQGKFLLAARQNRQGPYTEYIISLDVNDISQGSRAYVGKLRSDFVGTNFTIYDSEPPHDGAKPSRSKSTRRFASKQISPQVPAGNFEVGKVSYKFNLLRSKGPRRMVCLVNSRPLVGKKQISSPGNLSQKKLEPSSPSELAILRNKAPRWLEHLQCWCLNFHGRVTVASVKNFQLTRTRQVEKTSMRPLCCSLEKLEMTLSLWIFNSPCLPSKLLQSA